MRGSGLLVVGLCAVMLVGMVARKPVDLIISEPKDIVYDSFTPQILPISNGGFEALLPANKGLVYSLGTKEEWFDVPTNGRIALNTPDKRATDQLVNNPTSVIWLHPGLDQPSAIVFKVAQRTGNGLIGSPKFYTKVIADHHGLPVVSIVIPEGAFFDPDTGIYVVGNAIAHPDPDMIKTQTEDNRWWKYPGNYHFRGKLWQRNGYVQFLEADGTEVLGSEVGFRINGQMTRGFPIHALRLLFDKPLGKNVFENGEGQSSTVLLLRSGGNDQFKAIIRDALAHQICLGMPFDVANSRSCVVYINGAYWGIHQIRHKLEEEELSTRYDVKEKEIAMLEMRGGTLLGTKNQVAKFKEDLSFILSLDPSSPSFRPAIAERFDLDGFFNYMAAVMILDNKDWPDSNIKIWRYRGKEQRKGKLDGKWYFTLTDMDLGMGVYGVPEAELFLRIKGRRSPIPVLFMKCMESTTLQNEFVGIVEHMINGAFAADVMTAKLDMMIAGMTPEMPSHIDRWRKPGSMMEWKHEVDIVRRYLQARPEQINSQLHHLFP